MLIQTLIVVGGGLIALGGLTLLVAFILDIFIL